MRIRIFQALALFALVSLAGPEFANAESYNCVMGPNFSVSKLGIADGHAIVSGQKIGIVMVENVITITYFDWAGLTTFAYSNDWQFQATIRWQSGEGYAFYPYRGASHYTQLFGCSNLTFAGGPGQ